ncbi:hypothetical protein EDB85DRAFT_2296388 [Lactarius pseudohatsudake]|nr:hypothetical protein EDB85DRAFT_2296388 [Lactarius pseudohatsudake]
MIVFGFSHVDKCMLIISSVEPPQSGSSWTSGSYLHTLVRSPCANSTLLRLITFLALSSRLPLITLSVAALALVTFEKVRGLLTG